MYIRLLALVVLSLVLFVGPSSAATCITDGTSCSNLVTPTDTTAIFDFTEGGNGYLVVQFDTVLTTFTLTVDTSGMTDTLDPNEFPSGTVCVQYPSGQCVQYNISGSAGGPNGVPVKNTDYKGLISLTLSYDVLSTFVVHNPAFGHAAGDSNIFTVNILDAYSDDTICGAACDPTMHGKVPGPSSLIALDEPLTSNSDAACPLTLTPTNVASGGKPQIEVTLKEVSGSNCGGTGLRDKTASLSVSTFDSNGNFSFPALRNVEGNKFHWDPKNGLNEYDISTDGLVSGQKYTVTVFSSQVSPISATFIAP